MEAIGILSNWEQMNCVVHEQLRILKKFSLSFFTSLCFKSWTRSRVQFCWIVEVEDFHFLKFFQHINLLLQKNNKKILLHSNIKQNATKTQERDVWKKFCQKRHQNTKIV